MEIKKYNNFLIKENIDLDKLKLRLGEDYVDLKFDLLTMINTTLENISEDNVKINDMKFFIKDYISGGKDSTSIEGLIEDNDIFNFYLKNQSDIDQLLNETEYLSISPIDNNVFSLYDVVIDGTKQAIMEILKVIKNRLV